jgi:hypothetical protein
VGVVTINPSLLSDRLVYLTSSVVVICTWLG